MTYQVAVFDGKNWVSLRGDKGEQGASIRILGSLPGTHDLPASGSEGDSYLIHGNLHVWDEVNQGWVDVGTIQGPQGEPGIPGPAGSKGEKGDAGSSATVQVGTVTTATPGGLAKVTNRGTAGHAILDFEIPTGAAGPTGDKGDQGDAATIAIGGVTDTQPGTNATVVNVGTDQAAVLHFGIPRGQTGAPGADGARGPAGFDGADGAPGQAATIAIGQTSSGAVGTSPVVVNSGSPTNAVLEFTIPVGATGPRGNDGADGQSATISIGTVSSGASPSVTNVGTASSAVLNFVLQKGDKGDQGDPGQDGSGVTIQGTLDGGTFPPSGPHADGDMYIIGNPIPAGSPAGSATGDGVVYNGGAWTNVGPITGPQGPQGAVGPAGPSAVSTDLGNYASLGTDNLIFVPTPTIPTGSSANPEALGSVHPGSSVQFSKADHVHPLPTAAQVGAAAASHSHSTSDVSGLAAVAVSGNYGDLLGAPAQYTLPTASDSVLGGVKIGSGITIDGSGVISAAAATVDPATTTTAGIVTLADASAITSGDAGKVVTAAQLRGEVDLKASIASPTFTGSATIPGGSVSAPGLRFTGDSDTGVYQEAAGTVNVTANGSQRLSIGSAVTVPAGTTFNAGGNAYPQGTGTNGQVLTTDGAGALTWQDAAGSISPATSSTLGGVIIGTGLSVQGDGTIDVTYPTATTTTLGVVALADASHITAGSTGRVVDAAQLKSEADKRLPLSGGTMTGDISFTSGVSIGAESANVFAVDTAGVKRMQIGGTGQTNFYGNVVADGSLRVGGGASAHSYANYSVGATWYGHLITPPTAGELNATSTYAALRTALFPTGAATATAYGVQSVVNAEAGKTRWSFYTSGTAPSYLGNCQFNVGSQAAPSVSFLADPDSGMFSGGTDILGFSTGGASRLFIDAAGQIYTPAGYTPTTDNSLVTKEYLEDAFTVLTQAAYDALGTPDPTKIYLIQG